MLIFHSVRERIQITLNFLWCTALIRIWILIFHLNINSKTELYNLYQFQSKNPIVSNVSTMFPIFLIYPPKSRLKVDQRYIDRFEKLNYTYNIHR